MGYPSNSFEPDTVKHTISNMKEYEQMLQEHQNSDECSHTTDCAKCKQIKEWIASSSPTLP